MPLYLVLLALLPVFAFGLVVGVQGERALCRAEHSINDARIDGARVIDLHMDGGSWS